MSGDKDKINVNLVNRPQGQSWSEYIDLVEARDTRNDIRSVRDKLGAFSVRFVTEAMFGEEYARQVYGEDGGQELIRDVVINRKTLGTLAQTVGGQKTKAVAERTNLIEARPKAQPQEEEEQDNGAAQVELLRALIKMMDPAVVKKALGS